MGDRDGEGMGVWVREWGFGGRYEGRKVKEKEHPEETK